VFFRCTTWSLAAILAMCSVGDATDIHRVVSGFDATNKSTTLFGGRRALGASRMLTLRGPRLRRTWRNPRARNAGASLGASDYRVAIDPHKSVGQQGGLTTYNFVLECVYDETDNS
jgi:hypothetical protein